MVRRGLALNFDLGSADTARRQSAKRPPDARSDREPVDLHRYNAELERLHCKLQKTVGNKRKPCCRLLFGKEWELLDSMYQSVRWQMTLPPNCRQRSLPDKVQICLYHGYRLMTAYVRLTGLTRRYGYRRQKASCRWEERQGVTGKADFR